MLFCSKCFAPVPPEGKFCNFCGAKIEPKERIDPWLNKRFAVHYFIQKKLGTGSYGDVYQAEHVETKKPFAIKILRKTLLENPQTISRFQREGVAANRLEHPSALRIFECAQAESGEPYLVMEFVDGQSLKQCIEQRTLNMQEFFSIMLPLCEVLGEAHQKGIIHRDIKPDNIMLGRGTGNRRSDGSEQGMGQKLDLLFPIVKLLDFGLAGILGESKLTLTGTVIGTPPYMAPEQWGGLKFAEARSDLYALGVLAYRCLSGKYPFEAKNPAEWLKKHKFEEPIELRLAARWVPQNLSAVIMKLLEKIPSRRYQTPFELKEAFLRIQNSLEPTVIGGEDIYLEETSFRRPIKEPTEESPTQQMKEHEPEVELASEEFDSTQRVLHENLEESPTTSPFVLSCLSPNRALLRVASIGEKKIVITGSHGTLYHSDDLGVSWKSLVYSKGVSLYSLWLGASGESLVCGEGGLLLRLQQNTFQELEAQTNQSLYAIWGGSRGLYIVGENGTLLRKNGDVVFVLRLGQSTLFSGCQSAFGDLFAVGKKGTIFRSTDYGFTWSQKTSNTENDLHAITATKSGELICVGKAGTLLRSTDRGQSWSQEQSPFFDDLYDVDSTTNGTLYAVGSQGTILMRPSGAAQWAKVPSLTTHDLLSVSSLPNDKLVIVGDGGTVLLSSHC
jgi:serine/threonine protein kinase